MTQCDALPSHIMRGNVSKRKESSMLPPPEKEATDQFERYRPMMFSIAYRMLGSVTGAYGLPMVVVITT